MATNLSNEENLLVLHVAPTSIQDTTLGKKSPYFSSCFMFYIYNMQGGSQIYTLAQIVRIPFFCSLSYENRI